MATYAPDFIRWPDKAICPDGVDDFNQATAATFEVAAAVSGRQIQLVHCQLRVAAAVTVTFKTGTTAIDGGTFIFPAADTLELSLKHGVNIRTDVGGALQITLSGTVQVAGPIWYRYV